MTRTTNRLFAGLLATTTLAAISFGSASAALADDPLTQPPAETAPTSVVATEPVADEPEWVLEGESSTAPEAEWVLENEEPKAPETPEWDLDAEEPAAPETTEAEWVLDTEAPKAPEASEAEWVLETETPKAARKSAKQTIIATEPMAGSIDAPSITLEKSGNVDDTTGEGILGAGDRISYTFFVTNNGANALEGLDVVDAKLPAGVWCTVTTINPNESAVCFGNADYEVTDADAAAGSVVNTATARATDPSTAMTATATDSVTTRLSAAGPELTLTKDVSQWRGSYRAGQMLTWYFTVKNTGSVPLENVTLSDPKLTNLGISVDCYDSAGATATSMTLGPNETASCYSGYYTVTTADADAGKLVNTASVSGVCASGVAGCDAQASATSTQTIEPNPDPSFSFVKKVASINDANDNKFNDAGDTISWNFVVKNTGNITMSYVTIVDDFLADAGVAINCPASSIEAGKSMTCTSDAYTVSAADMKIGQVKNVAHAEGMCYLGGGGGDNRLDLGVRKFARVKAECGVMLESNSGEVITKLGKQETTTEPVDPVDPVDPADPRDTPDTDVEPNLVPHESEPVGPAKPKAENNDSLPVEVAKTVASTLPNTGGPQIALAIFGLVALLIGGVVLVRSRKARDA